MNILKQNIPENIYNIRPYAIEFLREISKYYEIVIFTNGTEIYANKILDDLDNNGYISHRLYRQHCTSEQDSHYKDLEKLGRDLSKTIIVDNSPHNFKYNEDNGLMIKTWKDDPTDEQLKSLGRLLIRIFRRNYSDVRKVIKVINEYLDNYTIKTKENPYDDIDLNNVNI